MKTNIRLLLVGLMVFTAGCATIKKSSSSHPAKHEENINHFWKSGKRMDARLTSYYKGGDKWSAQGQTWTGIPLQYITPEEVGVAAIPSKIPYGTIFRYGSLIGVGADRGRDVENRKAARFSGKNDYEKSLPVIDFCFKGGEPWPHFVTLEVFHYEGPRDRRGVPPKEIMTKLFDESFVRRIVSNGSKMSLEAHGLVAKR